MENKIAALLPKTHFPGTVYFGKSSLSYLSGLENQRNLVIVSRTVWERYAERIKSSLAKCDNEFLPFSSEPKKQDVDNLHERIMKGGYASVIGIGGGSVMDLAKTARLADGKIGLVMVPTTPGTGSEASRYSLVINENGEKEAMSSERLVPDVVLLDPSFLASVPRFEIVCASLDILAHAFEGLASRMSNPLSDSLAIKAIDMVFLNIEKVCENPDDMGAREGLQIAGFLAGLVQSSASVGIVHSFAHYFGLKAGVPHGAAVGSFLVEGLRFNSGRTAKYKKLDGSCTVSSSDFIQKLEGLLERLGFYGSVKMDFSKLDMEEASRKIKGDVCTRTNPCAISDEEIKGIVGKVMKHVKDR